MSLQIKILPVVKTLHMKFICLFLKNCLKSDLFWLTLSLDLSHIFISLKCVLTGKSSYLSIYTHITQITASYGNLSFTYYYNMNGKFCFSYSIILCAKYNFFVLDLRQLSPVCNATWPVEGDLRVYVTGRITTINQAKLDAQIS